MHLRSIHDLTTAEAYQLAAEHFGHTLPPLDAVENESWGRDYVLQQLQQHTAAELAAAGICMEAAEGEEEDMGSDFHSPASR